MYPVSQIGSSGISNVPPQLTIAQRLCDVRQQLRDCRDGIESIMARAGIGQMTATAEKTMSPQSDQLSAAVCDIEMITKQLRELQNQLAQIA